MGELEKGEELECRVLVEIRSLDVGYKIAGDRLEATYIIIIWMSCVYFGINPEIFSLLESECDVIFRSPFFHYSFRSGFLLEFKFHVLIQTDLSFNYFRSTS